MGIYLVSVVQALITKAIAGWEVVVVSEFAPQLRESGGYGVIVPVASVAATVR